MKPITERVVPPGAAEIRAARARAGLSQRAAARLVSASETKPYRTWQNYETDSGHPGHRSMPLALWELFLLLTQQHPSLRLLPAAAPAADLTSVLEQIAREELGIETLATRQSDALDFHDVSVAGLRRALAAAFHAGCHHAETARRRAPE